jgi:hypothetical protein
VLLDIQQEPFFSKIVPPIDEQEELESRRLWAKVTKAIMNRNLDLATHEKYLIEHKYRNQNRNYYNLEATAPPKPSYFVEEHQFWHYKSG